MHPKKLNLTDMYYDLVKLIFVIGIYINICVYVSVHICVCIVLGNM